MVIQHYHTAVNFTFLSEIALKNPHLIVTSHGINLKMLIFQKSSMNEIDEFDNFKMKYFEYLNWH